MAAKSSMSLDRKVMIVVILLLFAIIVYLFWQQAPETPLGEFISGGDEIESAPPPPGIGPPSPPDLNATNLTLCIDNDRDGFNASDISGLVKVNCGPVDCNDSNASINPGATENCTNRADDDCNGDIDCDDVVCADHPECEENEEDGSGNGNGDNGDDDNDTNDSFSYTGDNITCSDIGGILCPTEQICSVAWTITADTRYCCLGTCAAIPAMMAPESPAPEAVCGNGICEYALNETNITCPQDCIIIPQAVCGNGICETELGEIQENCPEDCGRKVPFVPIILVVIVATAVSAIAGYFYKHKHEEEPLEVTSKSVAPEPKPPRLKSDLQIARDYVIDAMKKGYTENAIKRALYLKNWNVAIVEHAFNSVRQAKELIAELGEKIEKSGKLTKPLRKYVEAAYDLGYPDKEIYELFWSLGFEQPKISKELDKIKELYDKKIAK